MTARPLIFTLYIFILAMTLQLIAPATASAVNWNSDPVAPITTTDTAVFWTACSTLAGTAPDNDVPGWVSWFAWTNWDTGTQTAALDSGMHCITVHYAADETTVTSLSIAFYRGQNLDVDWLFAQIQSQQ